MGLCWNRGTPSHHPFLDGIFLYTPTSYWGTPIDGNPHINMPRAKKSPSRSSAACCEKHVFRNCFFFLNPLICISLPTITIAFPLIFQVVHFFFRWFPWFPPIFNSLFPLFFHRNPLFIPEFSQDFHCSALPSVAAGGRSRLSWCCWAGARPCWVSPTPRRCGTRWPRWIHGKSMGEIQEICGFIRGRCGKSMVFSV